MMTHFCTLHKRGKDQSVLVEAFFHALADYTDEEVREAGYRCLEKSQYFPKPAELIKYIPAREKLRGRNDFVIKEGVRCEGKDCGRVTRCIQDPDFGEGYACRECYSGLTMAEYQARMAVIRGQIGKGIKEP